MSTEHPTRRVEASYDHAARGYDRRWAAYTRASLDLLRPYLPAAPDAVLDVGCGTGALHRALSAWGTTPRRYLGVDISAGMLRAARSGAGEAAFVRADAGCLPAADAAFGLVVSASSLHDWPELAAAFREMRRVLAPGGRVVLVDWCGDFTRMRLMQGWLATTGRPVRRVLTVAGLESALRREGLIPLRSERRIISAAWGLMAVEASAG